jgi:hypothetical protein
LAAGLTAIVEGTTPDTIFNKSGQAICEEVVQKLQNVKKDPSLCTAFDELKKTWRETKSVFRSHTSLLYLYLLDHRMSAKDRISRHNSKAKKSRVTSD